jgi:hypothetical protein
VWLALPKGRLSPWYPMSLVGTAGVALHYTALNWSSENGMYDKLHSSSCEILKLKKTITMTYCSKTVRSKFLLQLRRVESHLSVYLEGSSHAYDKIFP